jgi:hypothetical protein
MNGTIVFNNVYDPQLDTIIRVKERHETSLKFNPQEMQPINRAMNPYGQQQPIPVGASGQGYNNVVIEWEGDDGLAAISEMLHRIYPTLPIPPYPDLPAQH